MNTEKQIDERIDDHLNNYERGKDNSVKNISTQIGMRERKKLMTPQKITKWQRLGEYMHGADRTFINLLY